MRARKPCVRTRLILLGWYVRLVAMALLSGEISGLRRVRSAAAEVNSRTRAARKLVRTSNPLASRVKARRLALPSKAPNLRRVTRMCELWNQILTRLEHEIPEQQVNTWLRPLQAVRRGRCVAAAGAQSFRPVDWVQSNAAPRINALLRDTQGEQLSLVVEIGSRNAAAAVPASIQNDVPKHGKRPGAEIPQQIGAKLNPDSTFERFVEGKSNHFAKAAAMQVAENPGKAYNPLFIYGGTGLGKTHLMQAVGHVIRQRDPQARVAYVHSERFVDNMVQALRHNTMNEFKTNYRSLSALLIDDIQFFANKTQSQEEFFHTFNTLFEGQAQIILTSDRYPKEIPGLEERLKSRFGWGLSVAIEPPELETSVAILISKAQNAGTALPEEVAFFVAKRIRSNVRELEGALHRIIASSRFTGQPITLDFAKGSAARPAEPAGPPGHHREHPEDRGRLLQAAHVGDAFGPAQSFTGTTAPDRDGAFQGAHGP